MQKGIWNHPGFTMYEEIIPTAMRCIPVLGWLPTLYSLSCIFVAEKSHSPADSQNPINRSSCIYRSCEMLRYHVLLELCCSVGPSHFWVFMHRSFTLGYQEIATLTTNPLKSMEVGISTFACKVIVPALWAGNETGRNWKHPVKDCVPDPIDVAFGGAICSLVDFKLDCRNLEILRSVSTVI